MGGRGGSSSIVQYKPLHRGQITKYEAGILYKAAKNGDITPMRETTSLLYNEADKSIRFANERYHQNYLFYDRVEDLTRNILNKNFKKAQKIIESIEKDEIRLAGKRSPYYKYKK